MAPTATRKSPFGASHLGSHIMRVAFGVEQIYAPVPGGTGRYARELYSALRATCEPTDSMSAWSAWHRRRAVEADPVDGLRRLPVSRRGLIALWERGLPPRIGGADLIHAPTPLTPPTSGPLVVTVHDAVPWTHPETLTPRGARWHRDMIGRAVRSGAAIAVPTRATGDQLQDVFPNLERDRVHVLGAGRTPALAIQSSDAEAGRIVAELNLPDRFVLTLATLEPRKGLGVLLDATVDLGSIALPVVVVGQVGWGGLDPAIEAARRGLTADQVRVLGRLSDAQLSVVLRRAELLAMPSLAEGFGLPALEAMAVGTPVIVTDDPALLEVTGGAALSVPRGDPQALANALRDAEQDERLRADLAIRGAARAAGFTWDAVAGRAWNLYRSLT